MVAGKRRRGEPRQIWEKDITDAFGTMAAASRVAEDRHQFRRDIWADDEDMLREVKSMAYYDCNQTIQGTM